MCKVYVARAPDALTYFAHFVAAKDAMFYGSVESQVAGLVDEAGGEEQWNVAVVREYCELKGFEAALLIEDMRDESNDIVAFGLSAEDAARAAGRIEEYVDAVKRALDAMPVDELESCYYLDAGADVDKCLAMAREVLASEKAEAG